MYYFKRTEKLKFLGDKTIDYMAKKIGITRCFLTSVLKGSRACSKLVAYAITKTICFDSEIQDYFTKTGV